MEWNYGRENRKYATSAYDWRLNEAKSVGQADSLPNRRPPACATSVLSKSEKTTCLPVRPVAA